MRVDKRYFRFSLFTLFVVASLSSILLAWAVLSSPSVVRTKLRIRPDPVSITGQPTALTAEQLADYRRTILTDVRSDQLLVAVLRDPRIAGLAPLQGVGDPVAWLRRNLIVDFPVDTEILTLSLETSEQDKIESVTLLNAVAKKFAELELLNSNAGRTVQAQTKRHAAEEMKDAIARKESSAIQLAESSGRDFDDSKLADEERTTLHQQWHTLLKDAERIDLSSNREPPVLIFEPATAGESGRQ